LSAKIGTPVICVLGKVGTNFGFSTLFYFYVRSPYTTDRRMNGKTDG